ncbi:MULTISPECIES: ABC transporter permease subunit [unclassified Actinomyces]|uniref:ABC transporter permease n=1 Tax=unclassified Actinomyces TaxID=2609248 RepID=UPI002018034A|nr:ABC transporter permease subunit [Actinomyces sp. 187325]
MAEVVAPQAVPAETQPVLAAETDSGTRRKRDKARRRRSSRRGDWQLYTLVVIPVIWFIVFRYAPMIGNVIAFRRFTPGGSMYGEEWVGLRYVKMFISDPTFWRVFRNTVTIGFTTLLVSFPMPIILALLLNEVRRTWFKRAVQTVSYLPHFLSMVIIAGIIMEVVSVEGPINQVIRLFGGDAVNFIQNAKYFVPIYVISDVWQTVGWGTILYLAALTTIDDSLYEAAQLDGANRLQQTWHITLPGIRPTIVTLLVLNVGSFLAVGFEKILLIYNPLTYSTGDVISTYLYRVGLQASNFSYAAAIGLFESLIGLTLVLTANFLSRKLANTSLW